MDVGIRSRARKIRLLVVAAFVLVLAVGYLVLLRHFKVAELPNERNFGATGEVKPVADVYIEATSIDPLNRAMELRATLTPGRSQSNKEFAPSDRGLTLLIASDRRVEEVKLPPNERSVAKTFEVYLNNGSVAYYPLDRYRADLGVEVFEGNSSAPPSNAPVPSFVTVWEGMLGFDLHAIGRPVPGRNLVQLSIDISRSGAFALFALAAYGAMVMLGLCALGVGTLTFADVRRPEATLIGALAAIAFALPVLRSALPGSPPLGVRADMFVFLWTELAAVIALGLLVVKWALTGPRP